MMGHRMARMRAMLGYDLLIPANSLDREVSEFVSLMRPTVFQKSRSRQPKGFIKNFWFTFV